MLTNIKNTIYKPKTTKIGAKRRPKRRVKAQPNPFGPPWTINQHTVHRALVFGTIHSGREPRA